MKPTAISWRRRLVQRSGRRQPMRPRLLVERLESRNLLSTTSGSLSFFNTPLLTPDGSSEPEVSIGSDGNTAVVALNWLRLASNNLPASNLWTGTFGETPTFRGPIDTELQQPGRTVYGGGDVDVNIGSDGTIHATSLVFLVNPTFLANNTELQLGVSAITIPADGDLTKATAQIIDTAGADRPWITSDGSRVWISYHDAKNSTLIHVQRSDDNGDTWHLVGDPIVGQDGATANATFNNIQGPIVADPYTHNLYDIYAAGETGFLKGRTFTPNNIYVASSTDRGKTWTSNLVYHAQPGTSLASIFPALAVDPTNGKLYAAWSDGHNVSFATSSDQGVTWSSQSSPPTVVNIAPAKTAIFPWVAAYNSTVDVVYYATDAASKDDTSAVWNVYLAQTANDGASFTQSRVSNTPNHEGVICTEGSACPRAERTLLDLFEVAIDPKSGRAGVVYTDDTLTKDSSGNPLPQVVLAYQNDPPATTSLQAASTASSFVAADQATSAQLAYLAPSLQPLDQTAIYDPLATPSVEMKKRRWSHS
jgi:hypothetical protein